MEKSPLQYALNLLKLRDRTVGEIRDKMKQKGFEQAEIEVTINFLTEKGFLDDERFVTNFIRNKQQFGSAGKYKIKFKLEQLKVNRELINQKLAEVNPESEIERAKELAQNWLNKKQTVLPEKKYEKLGRFLVSKGFEIDIVKNVLHEALKK
jgi:regulatory protein